MVASKTQAPHFYLTMQVDVTEALALRRQFNAQTRDGVRISVNDLVVKAAAMALTAFPELGAVFAGDALDVPDHVSIAVAVTLEDGLVTPVVQYTDRKSLVQIAREIQALAERARAEKSHVEDYAGATFTVSNLGMFGVDMFAAIINPPQAAILAVGAAQRVPVYLDDQVVPRDRLNLTLSVDHRVTDGATAARFLAEVRDYLEAPTRLLY
jgi:pyruvate dehydrogenase E2 component (dihydrolipoamide acetyltransferase)